MFFTRLELGQFGERKPVNAWEFTLQVTRNKTGGHSEVLSGLTDTGPSLLRLQALNREGLGARTNHLNLNDVLGHFSGFKRDHLLNGYVSRVTRANDQGPSHSYRDTSGASNISDLMLLEVALNLLSTCGFFHDDPFKIG